MNCKEIIANNMFSYENLRLSLESGKKYLIIGRNYDAPGFSSNGAGKSSIFDIVTSVLYGRTVRGPKSKALRYGQTKGYGCVLLNVDGKDIFVRRPFGEDRNHLIVSGGKTIRCEYSSDFNNFIQSLVPPFKIFLETAYVSSQNVSSLLGGTKSDREMLAKYLVSIDFDYLISRINQSIQIANSNVSSLNEKMSNLKYFVTTYEQLEHIEDIQKLKQEMSNINQLLSEMQKERDELKNKLELIQKDFNEKTGQITMLRNKMDLIDRHRVCPTCGRRIPESHKSKMREKILEEIENIRRSIPTGIDKLKEQVKMIEFELQSKDARKHEISTRILVYESIKSKLTMSLEEVHKAIKEVTSSLNEAQQMVELLGILKSSVNEVRDIFFNNILKEVRNRFSQYLRVISGGVMDVAEEDDEIKILINNNCLDLAQISGGERRRCDLCMLFAIRDVLATKNRIDFVFLDEIFTLMDEEGKDRMISMLTGSPYTVMTTAQEEDIQGFDYVIVVEKRCGVSTIKVVG